MTGQGGFLFPHMCRDDHPDIGHDTDEERCPVCIERDRADAAEARVRELEQIHRDEMDLHDEMEAKLAAEVRQGEVYEVEGEIARAWVRVPFLPGDKVRVTKVEEGQ